MHQSVICGGNHDVDKCHNYFGIHSDIQKKNIINILSSETKPNLNQLVENCLFFIADYKGEDMGYARQLNFYTKREDLVDELNEIVVAFPKFQEELKNLNAECTDLEEYKNEIESIEKRYGC